MSADGITIGIRREDKNRWERRVPLTPSHVRYLVDNHHLRVLIQPSHIRCFTDDEYRAAGATVQEDLSPAQTIFAVKEVPIHLLQANKTYVFFSYTIKAQPHSMPLLDSVLEKNIRLIDYERITDKNSRLVRFGPFGGYAGMVDTLHALGDRLLALGFATPFMHILYSRYYSGLDEAKQAVKRVGDMINNKGLPRELCPFTITRTGTGSVAKGVQAILDMLPCKYVDPFELENLWKNPDQVDNKVIYVAVATAQHMVEHKEKKNS